MLDWTEWVSQMWSLMKKYSFIRSLWPWAWWIGDKVEHPLQQPLEKDVSESFWSWRWATWRMTPWSYESCTKGMVLAISPPFPLPLQKNFLDSPGALTDKIIPQAPRAPTNSMGIHSNALHILSVVLTSVASREAPWVNLSLLMLWTRALYELRFKLPPLSPFYLRIK